MGNPAADVIDKGDTAWVLVSAALVMLMTPGLAFFYGGLVRKKNVLSILMQCFIVLCLVSLQWVTFGYSLAFGPDKGGVLGGLDFAFLRGWGALDFAGGTVVHVNAGMAALAVALALGPRLGYPHQMSPPHNLPFAVLGAGILWFGWFGFNAGSALGSGALAANAFVVTHVAAAAAGVTWAVLDTAFTKAPTALGMITGVVAGLVAITPASGFVGLGGALAIGAGAAAFPYFAVAVLKNRLRYDDTLDAFGVHGVGGLWGSLATGLFASKEINPAGADGLFFGGGFRLLGVQAATTGITLVFAFAASYALLLLVKALLGLRVSEHEERVGLDLTQHREAGYTLVD